jgi:hypothetical protein
MSLRQCLNAGSSPETAASRIITLDREPGECVWSTVNSCYKTVMIAVITRHRPAASAFIGAKITAENGRTGLTLNRAKPGTGSLIR